MALVHKGLFLPIILGIFSSTAFAEIEYKTIDRSTIEMYLHDLRHQVVDFYREYPYLFVCEGGVDNESCEVYLNSQRSLMVAAFDNQKMIGVIVGLPLAEFNAKTCGAIEKELIYARDTFRDVPIALEDCYYINEMCVMSGYDRDEIANNLFNLFEEVVHSKKMGYTYLSMVILEPSQNHPMRPQDPAQRWAEREAAILADHGFAHTDYKVVYSWPTLQVDGSVAMQENPMNFWFKRIA